jgi:hypothetical protein
VVAKKREPLGGRNILPDNKGVRGIFLKVRGGDDDLLFEKMSENKQGALP